jgi:ribonuclease G
MAKEICISSTPHETRLAILEDDQLAEIYYERENEYTLAGSIYNGRVTRVLPGMQSAFVDVGLERDAFLYVTDFLELEDQEETDEVEKAAATGSNTPPREVRHTGGPERGQDRVQDRKDQRGQKPEQKQEQRPERPSPERPSLDKQVSDRPAQDRPTRERRFTVEAVPETGEVSPAAPAPTYASEQAAIDKQESDEPGAKRWRGRRRRRGGRGATGSQESQGETGVSGEVYAEAAPEPEVAEGIQAEAGAPATGPRRRGGKLGFLLPTPGARRRPHTTLMRPLYPLFCPASPSQSTAEPRLKVHRPQNQKPLLRLVPPAASSPQP